MPNHRKLLQPPRFLFAAILALLLFAPSTNAQEKTKLVKIRITAAAQASQVSKVAPQVLVREKGHLVVRGGPEEIKKLQAEGFAVEDASESDLVQRLVRIHSKDPLQRRMILEISNVDVWEYQPDSMIARAFDSQIETLRRIGLQVDILYDNALQQVAAFAPAISADAGLYHTHAEVDSELHALAAGHPAIASVSSLGNSVQGRALWAIKISDNVGTNEPEPEILILGCHHAREWISVEVPFLLAKHLVTGYATDPLVKQLVDGLQIWIIPMTNPDGHQHSLAQDRLWRKNRRPNGDGSFGVDLNRNYGYEWGGTGSSGDTVSDIYRGPAAFSEPESRTVRDLVNSRAFRTIITYHSYSQLVLYPWGYTYDASPDESRMSQTATSLADAIRNVHGIVYTPQQSSDLYLTSGDTTDWSYGDHHVPAFTIELRPKTFGEGGFVLPESQIQPTWEENRAAILDLLRTHLEKGRPTVSYQAAWHVKTKYADETTLRLSNPSGEPCGLHLDFYDEAGANVGQMDIPLGARASAMRNASAAIQGPGSGLISLSYSVGSQCRAGATVDYLKAGQIVGSVVLGSSPQH
jgi:carboxypeptidase T